MLHLAISAFSKMRLGGKMALGFYDWIVCRCAFLAIWERRFRENGKCFQTCAMNFHGCRCLLAAIWGETTISTPTRIKWNDFLQWDASVTLVLSVSPAQVMNLVDKKTQKALLDKDSAEIWKILTGPGVDWQSRAICLRHPANASGCKIAMQCDLDSWTKYGKKTWKWVLTKLARVPSNRL